MKPPTQSVREASFGREQAEVLGHVAGFEQDVAVAARAVLVERPVEDRGHEDERVRVLEERRREEGLGESVAVESDCNGSSAWSRTS